MVVGNGATGKQLNHESRTLMNGSGALPGGQKTKHPFYRVTAGSQELCSLEQHSHGTRTRLMSPSQTASLKNCY